jgi:hypothetical protein
MSENIKGPLDQVLSRARQAWDEHRGRGDRPVETARPTEADPNSREAQLRRLLRRGVRLMSAEIIVDGGIKETPALKNARALDERRDGTMVLSGPRGCGKSVAASWLVSRNPNWTYIGDHYDGKNGHWPIDYAPRFVDASQLGRIWRTEPDLRDAICNCSTLAVDDVGTEFSDEKGWLRSILDELVVTRHDSRLKTLLTTNIAPRDLGDRYGERITDRINSSAGAFGLQGPSLRDGG